MGNVVRFENKYDNFIDSKIRTDSYLTLTAINAMNELEITSIEDIKAYQVSCHLDDTGVIDINTFNNMIFDAFDPDIAQDVLNSINKKYFSMKDDKKEKRKQFKEDLVTLVLLILFFVVFIDGAVDIITKLYRYIVNLIK